MAIEIKIPDIGTDEVEVTEVLVSVGDKVEAMQSLITVEGDKTSMEIPSPQSGVVKELKVAVGDKVTTGTIIMVFESVIKRKAVNVPDIGSNQVEITEVLVKVGDKIKAEQSLLTVEGDKASIEIPAPFSGIVKEININVGDKVSTGSLIMVFEVEDAQSSKVVIKETTATEASMPAIDIKRSNVTKASKQNQFTFTENDAYIHATPVIRRLAREFGINLAQVQGTGRKGRILREDIQIYLKKEAYQKEAYQEAASFTASGSALQDLLPLPKVDFSKFGNIEEVELSRIQKISGANMYRNWVMIPHVTQFDEADITEVEAFRKQQNAEADKNKLDIKITILVFIMKVIAKALEELPRFNSSLSADAKILTLKKYINIGVAVDTSNGLVVPVFRNVNNKSIVELSRELVEISNKARASALSLADMQGGCFTISSLGGIGGTAFTPIINAPEVAILGISKSLTKPVWNGQEFAPRLMLPLSLSYDHRVIDGADGARFISYIKNILSDIRRLIM